MADKKMGDLATQLQQMIDVQDFSGALKLIDENKDLLTSKMQSAGVREILKKATKDRLLLSFIDSVGFGIRPLVESLGRLKRLISYCKGTRVLNAAFGLGTIREVDYFYRKVTVDFTMRKGHQLTFDAACETLTVAPENHILVIAAGDPVRIQGMLKDQPGDFVKEMLRSFGDMPLTRLEDECDRNGFVKKAGWKDFWNRARADLAKDKLVEVPTKRTEPLHLKASAETYGDTWFTAFLQITDPKSILSSVKELVGSNRLQSKTDDEKMKIADRLAFALKGARGTDDALYARLAFTLDELKLNSELVAKSRRYLWENDRYLKAALELPAKDVGTLVTFMTADNREETKKNLFAVLGKMNFPFVQGTLDFFLKDEDCQDAVAALLKTPHPPATLVVAILGRYEKFEKAKWSRIPSLSAILQHAIALGEGRQVGEVLRMQNVVRRLFADQTWLKGVFEKLTPEEHLLLFERFQASVAWEASTHKLITIRMTNLDTALKEHIVRKDEKKVEERVTSQRSYNEKKAAYDRLVNVEMPENTKKIEFARSYGDLSENAEYQYAKDEQRALLQKQNLMQEDLNNVKPVLFEGVIADEVKPGTIVKVATAAGEKIFVILGEWDNEPTLGVISNKTKLAANMLGKKAGEAFELPEADGSVGRATITAVEPLTADLLTWVKGE